MQYPLTSVQWLEVGAVLFLVLGVGICFVTFAEGVAEKIDNLVERVLGE